MAGKPWFGKPSIGTKNLRTPRGGPPGDVECPLSDSDEIPFDDCLECEHHDFGPDYCHCQIIAEEEKEALRKEREEIDREAEDWKAHREEEDRKMREEMAEWRREMEKAGNKWEKEYEKEQAEYEKLEEEWREMDRKRLVSLYGEELVEACEGSDGDEDEEEDEEEGEEEDDEYE